MELVQVAYAKAHFSALLDRVEQGEELVIARRSKTVARLVPEKTIPARRRRPLNRCTQWVGWICPISWTKGMVLLLPNDDVNLD